MDNTVKRGGEDREKALRGHRGWGPEHVREEEPLQDERDMRTIEEGLSIGCREVRN